MARTRGDACCDCLSLGSLYLLLAGVGAVEVVVWAALQSIFIFTGEYDHTPCGSPEGLAAESPNSTKLKLLIPGTGTSGTTSVHTALCMMGYRSYHAEERAVFAHRTMIDNIEKEVMASSISRCQVDALFLEPTTDAFPRMLEVSPDTKVVLTWRDFPSYYKSIMHGQFVQDAVTTIINYMSSLPLQLARWDDWWDFVSRGQIQRGWHAGEPFGCPGGAQFPMLWLTSYHFRQFDLANRLYSRGSFKIAWYEEAYLAQHDEIRRLTPPGKLLEFNVKKHSWKELEDFLGVSAGALAQTAFPNPRKTNPFTHNHVLMNNPIRCIASYGVGILISTLQAWLLSPLLRWLRRYLCCFCRQRHRERWLAKEKEQ